MGETSPDNVHIRLNVGGMPLHTSLRTVMEGARLGCDDLQILCVKILTGNNMSAVSALTSVPQYPDDPPAHYSMWEPVWEKTLVPADTEQYHLEYFIDADPTVFSFWLRYFRAREVALVRPDSKVTRTVPHAETVPHVEAGQFRKRLIRESEAAGLKCLADGLRRLVDWEREDLQRLLVNPGAVLHGARLQGQDLSMLGFGRCCLKRADFRNCILNKCDFESASMEDAIFVGANLSDCNFSGANLSRADLRNTNLSNSILKGTDFSDADLCGSDLSGSNLCGANFTNAKLHDTNMPWSRGVQTSYDTPMPHSRVQFSPTQQGETMKREESGGLFRTRSGPFSSEQCLHLDVTADIMDVLGKSAASHIAVQTNGNVQGGFDNLVSPTNPMSPRPDGSRPVGSDGSGAHLMNGKPHVAHQPWGSGMLGVNWSGARFGGTRWVPYDKDLHEVKLKGADLTSCQLRGVNMKRADLSCCKLIDADLSKSILRGADFSESELSSANMSGADLSGAKFNKAIMCKTKLCNARLKGAHLSGSELSGSLSLYLSLSLSLSLFLFPDV